MKENFKAGHHDSGSLSTDTKEVSREEFTYDSVLLLRCVSPLLSTLHNVDWAFKRQESLVEAVT
jgi:hypothetical protein